MNDIMANIKSRRSKRAFAGTEIPDNTVKEIIEAGCYAPSALNKQPWNFIIVKNRDVISVLSSMVKKTTGKIVTFLPILKLLSPKLKDPQVIAALNKTISTEADNVFYKAPLLIFILSKKGQHYASRDCALAAQNMMLYSHSIGISSCYIGRADLLQSNGPAKKMIGVPAGYAIEGAIVFGYAEKDTDASAIPNRRQDTILKWIR